MHLFKFIRNFLRRFRSKNLPNKPPNPDFYETREKSGMSTREVKSVQKAENLAPEPAETPQIHQCPYCSSKNIVRRGIRRKKYESQQRYLCNDCQRSFVPQMVKGKSFPLKVILDGLSFYNTGYTLGESCKFLKENYGIEVKDSTLSDWVKEFEPLCRYSRLRPYGLKLF